MKKNTTFVPAKVDKKSLYDNFFSKKESYEALEFAYRSVKDGLRDADSYIRSNPYEFINKGHKANTINAKVVSKFCQSIEKDYRVRSRIKQFYTYKMTYFLVDNKILLCFKAIDKNGMVQNMPTGRHNSVMMGNEVAMNHRVEEELRKLGVEGQPPIYYIGYYISETGRINVKCVRYFNNRIAFELNLSKMFASKVEDIRDLVKNNKVVKSSKLIKFN